MTKCALTPRSFWEFGYNNRNELTTGDRREDTPGNPGDLMTPGDYDYTYDPIGNRSSSELDSTTQYCCVDEAVGSSQSVNKYVTIDDASGCPKDPADESFSYEDNSKQDGNLNIGGGSGVLFIVFLCLRVLFGASGRA